MSVIQDLVNFVNEESLRFANNEQARLFIIFLMILALWSLPWKGYALWKSARLGDKWWFIALLLVNSLAILEILYIFIWSRKKPLLPDATRRL